MTAEPSNSPWQADSSRPGPHTALLEGIFAALPHPIYVHDRAARCIYLNPSGAQVFGLAPGDMIGRSWRELDLAVEVLEPLEAALQEAFATGEPVTRTMTWSTGRDLRDYEVVLTRLDAPASNGDALVVSVARDVTEDRTTAAQLKLPRSDRELEEFAAIASHDLQEPLRAIIGYLQLVRQHLPADDPSNDYVDRAASASNRMQALINDLLAYSRLGSRAQPLERTDSRGLLDEVLKSLQAALTASGAEVTQDPLPVVVADRTQLGQVFQNLIANAVKFVAAERPPHVHVSASRADGAWRFSVRDNGIGIEPEQTERIFGIFQRLHTAAEYPGTGVGLAVCKRVVERHGGRIWVESEPGRGSTFYFTIPDRE